MNEFNLTFLLDRFEERYAVLRNENTGEVRWPIRLIPEYVKIGDEITMQLIDKKLASSQSEDEKYKLMQRLLEELIN